MKLDQRGSNISASYDAFVEANDIGGVTIVPRAENVTERASQLRGRLHRRFLGVGFDVAEKMGLVPTLEEHGYSVEEIQWVNAGGCKTGSFDPDVLRKMSDGRFVDIERSNLAAAIYGTIAGKVETIFDDSITGIEERIDGVPVAFENSAP